MLQQLALKLHGFHHLGMTVPHADCDNACKGLQASIQPAQTGADQNGCEGLAPDVVSEIRHLHVCLQCYLTSSAPSIRLACLGITNI